MLLVKGMVIAVPQDSHDDAPPAEGFALAVKNQANEPGLPIS